MPWLSVAETPGLASFKTKFHRNWEVELSGFVPVPLMHDPSGHAREIRDAETQWGGWQEKKEWRNNQGSAQQGL